METNTEKTMSVLPQNAVEAFDAFLNCFNSKQSYILKEEQGNFWEQNSLEATYQEYCAKSKDEKNKDKKFNDVIKDILARDTVKREKTIDIINHAVWLWALPNIRKAPWILISPEKKLKDDLLKITGVAGGGSGYVQTKTNGVRFILYLFTIIINESQDARQVIKEACKQKKYPIQDQTYVVPDGVKNLLLHLCDPNNYEPIAASADKDKIVKAFEGIVELNGKSVDDNIKIIRAQLEKQGALSKGASFYSNSLPLMWKGESTTDLSLLQKLEYKKAMILYGPPGTGKTYTAMELAKEMIVRYYMKQYKKSNRVTEKENKNTEKLDPEATRNECFDVLKNIEEKKKHFISYLQFHINYNYEDFIAGQVIDNKTIDTKKGFIFDVIKKAERNPEIPYVVILDEINRTDISRVFGELFTAIEKRGEAVKLTLPKPKKETVESTEEEQSATEGQKTQGKSPHVEDRLELTLPGNIYFIGTMNEIDFSLERVDFALRRRFIWELHDYSEDALENIVKDRFEQYTYKEWFNYFKDKGSDEEEAKKQALQKLSSTDDSKDDDQEKELKNRIMVFNEGATLSDFCISCSNLNKEVEKAMGKAYHIGHAFFAEIANLYIELKKNNVSTPWRKAKKILWEISIKPTLDAYCGSMDKSEKDKYLKANEGDFYKAFFKFEELKDEESEESKVD